MLPRVLIQVYDDKDEKDSLPNSQIFTIGSKLTHINVIFTSEVLLSNTIMSNCIIRSNSIFVNSV